MVRHAPTEHWSFFVFMAVYTGITYFVFAWFREQVCIVLCPYGRIQSALTDDHTLVIGYDALRGEPRRHRAPAKPGLPADLPADPSAVALAKEEVLAKEGPPSVGLAKEGLLAVGLAKEGLPAVGLAKEGLPAVGLAKEGLPAVGLAKAGDCVACNRCVHVCPTGIDIRQGLQLECVGCTACIDACDDVMDRLQRPRGLIRYDSPNGFAGRPTRWVRPRTILYFILLLVGAGVATWALSTLKPASLGVTRMTGAPYIVDATMVRNQFLVRLVNKRNAPDRFTVRIEGAPADLRRTGFDAAVEVGPLGELVQPLVLQQPRAGYRGPFHFVVQVEAAARTFTLRREVEFLGPEARLLREEEEEQQRARGR
jgi:polyferredoxin